MERQFVFNVGDDFDVIGVVFDVGMVCVYVLFICQGKVLGSCSYFLKVSGGMELGEVVEIFVGQFYLQSSQMCMLLGEILFDFNLSDKMLLVDLLLEFVGWCIYVQIKLCGDCVCYFKLVWINVVMVLIIKFLQQFIIMQCLIVLVVVLKFFVIKWMECFDISYIMGE